MSEQLYPLVIKASAGTGKTFQLTNRYLRLLFMGERCERILATTFTRKAAGEIRARILTRLAKAAISDEEATKLSAQIGVKFGTTQAQQVLSSVLCEQHRMRICTFDSLFFQIASSFSYELGLPAGWSIAEETTNQKIQREVVRNICSQKKGEVLIRLMHFIMQGKASRRIEAAILSELVGLHNLYRETDERAWKWLDKTKDPSDKELSNALEALGNMKLPQTQTGKPRAFWQKDVSRIKEEVSAGRWDSICGSGILNKILLGENSYDRTEITAEHIQALEPFVKKAMAVFLAKLKAQNEALYEMLGLYDREYAIQRTRMGNLGFDDVKFFLAQSATFGNLDEVYYRLDARIHHLLLDEFQDTSTREWHICEPIVDEVLSKASGEYSFFCVGDVKQAIYGWRGGNAGIFSTIKERNPHVQEEPLVESRRCAPAIIATTNLIFQDLKSNPALTDVSQAAENWSSEFLTQKTVIDQAQGHVVLYEVETQTDEQKLSVREQEDIIYYEAVRKVAELLQTKPSATIGILARRNDVVRRIAQICRSDEFKLDVSEEGKSSIVSSEGVQLCLSAFELAEHPDNTIAAYHLAGVGVAEVLGLKKYSDASSRYRYSAKLRRLIKEQGFGQTARWLKESIQGFCLPAENIKLEQFVELSFRFESNGSSRIDDLIHYLGSEKTDDSTTAQVRIMTVHQSKGLEFDIVVLPELQMSLKDSGNGVLIHREGVLEPPMMVSRSVDQTKALFDPRLQMMKNEQIVTVVEEALCVLYVALTRARWALYMFIKMPSDEDKYACTYADLIRAALKREQKQSDGIRFEIGENRWPVDEIVEQHNKPDLLQEIELLAPPKQPTRSLQREHPSGLEGNQIYEVTNILDFANRAKRKAALNHGGIIHKCFEAVEWLDDGYPSKDDLVSRSLSVGYEREAVEKAVDEFLSLITNKEIKVVLCRDHYLGHSVRVYREHPFAYQENGILMSGSVDRLVVINDGVARRAEILDYKTDTIKEEDLERRTEFYRPQIEAYRKAMSRFLKLDLGSISASLLYVKSGRVMSI